MRTRVRGLSYYLRPPTHRKNSADPEILRRKARVFLHGKSLEGCFSTRSVFRGCRHIQPQCSATFPRLARSITSANQSTLRLSSSHRYWWVSIHSERASERAFGTSGSLDEELSRKNIFLILCGSAVSFIAKEVFGEKNPLYGRARTIMKVRPLPFQITAQFVPHSKADDVFRGYAVLGGIPYFWQDINPQRSLTENLASNLLRRQLPDVSYSQRLEGSKKTINAWKSKKKTCALRAFSL